MKKQKFISENLNVDSGKQKLEVEDAFADGGSCYLCAICAANTASAGAIGYIETRATGLWE